MTTKPREWEDTVGENVEETSSICSEPYMLHKLTYLEATIIRSVCLKKLYPVAKTAVQQKGYDK